MRKTEVPIQGSRLKDVPYQLREQQNQELSRLDSPAARLRYLEETVGLDENAALRTLSAWIESQGTGFRTKEHDSEPPSERVIEYDPSDASPSED